MIFTDLLFVLAFLPISCVAILAFGEVWEKNVACIILSLVLLVWARPLYILLVLLPVLLTYISARLLDKSKSKAVYISASAISAAVCLGLAAACGSEGGLSGAVTSVAMLMLAHKTYCYLSDVYGGEKSEKDIVSLAVYFISYEFLFFNPIMKYSQAREKIKTRSPKLSGVAVGMQSFIVGLAEATVLGLSLERARAAALLGESLPWGNLALGLLFTVLEAYVMLDGYIRMSAGISTVNGISAFADTNGLIPRLSILDHMGDVYPAFIDSIKASYSGGARLFGMLAACLCAGVCLAFGATAGAIISLFVAGALIVISSDGGLFERIFTIILALSGFILSALGGLEGVSKLGGLFSYDFDMSYALYDELTRVAPWLIISLFCVTPMPRVLAGMWRERMAESSGVYSAMRVAGCVASVIMLGVSVLAMMGMR